MPRQSSASSCSLDEASFALTPMQTALVYEGVGTDRPWINLEQVVVEFQDTRIDDARLVQVWQKVTDRHDALRLVLDWRASPPVQRCLVNHTPSVAIHDDADSTADSVGKRTRRFLEADRIAGVDLSKTPGWRVNLLRFSETSSVMVWTIHHALVDGRSMAQIIAEVLILLDGGQLPDVPPAQNTYRTHVGAISSANALHEDASAFFKEHLAELGDAGVLSLPANTGKLRASDRKTILETVVPSHLHTALDNQAAVLGATTASVVQTAWGLVLARWAGRNDVAFGTVRSGRHALSGAAGTAGCFINTLPLRLRLDPALTLAAAVQQVRRATIGLHPFEQASASLMRRASGLDGRQPLFNSVVMFERASFGPMVHKMVPTSCHHRITLHEEGGAALSLSVYADSDMRIALEHDPSVVGDAQASALLSHLVTLLCRITDADPDDPVGTLGMLGATEEAELHKLAQADLPLGPTGDCLVRNFLDVVLRTPDATAIGVAGHDDTLSYAELDNWADRIAAQLNSHQITTGDVVAVRLPRSAAFIAAILGVLKTGAAFVPVDPSYPDAVQAHMLEDSAAKVVICGAGLEDTSGLILIDPAAGEAAQTPCPLPAVDPEELAYILYTSGSTGKPKGVQVTRRNLLCHIAAITSAFALQPSDRVLQFASLSFDVALEEVFPTLMSGAALILRNNDMAQSASSFLEMAGALQITVANLPTAFWHVLTDYVTSQNASVPASLRLLIVGGELPASESLISWRAAAPHVRWLCGYGPTEATITCTLFDADDRETYSDVPIGRPTAHARIYVLAPDHSLAPRGAVGELAIGGEAVTRGYVGQPVQTAKVFLADRFAPNGRTYLSGDRAHWLSGGNLGFLGRNDRQVKLRGFRMDLRQIERAIEADMAGLRVLATVLEAGTPAARLVAWVTGATLPEVADLKAAAGRVLPAHMQPFFLVVDSFPRTAGGKIDMAALPVPQIEVNVDPVQGTGGGLTSEVAELMAALLGQPHIGADQSFFDLGGHSLLMVDLIGRLEALAGVRLGPAEFYENPTPRHLAKLLRKGSKAPKHIIPIQPEGIKPPIFAVHILGAKEEYFRPLAKALGDDQPVMGVSLASLGPDAPTGIIKTASRYCEDINTYHPDGPINLVAVSLASYLAVELAHQLVESGREIRLLAIFDAAGPAGRDQITGLPRISAHLRSVRYSGWKYPKQIIHNRLYDLRIAMAAQRLSRAARKGNAQPPANAAQFDAANEAAVNQYTPASLNVPLKIFRAKSNFFDTKAGIQSGLGWADVAKSGFEVIDVPGGHLSMLEEPHVQTIAERLRDHLTS